ncbi:MAG: redoxin domain-containing protein [Acidimicrobiia bacterium]|nr:redoxin domain-containing protein [Acidimicrobiia bacterium]MDH4308745.1 redoxin domain-containing protein [Acidimicrobiia bacterium]
MLSSSQRPVAPELDVIQWFNTPSPLSLEKLRGEVVVLEAFQMLCPGCVSHGLPLAARIHTSFGPNVNVIGIHTVFEHHAAMTPVSLEAFLHEYRIAFPVGVDRPASDGAIPATMERYQLRGTPSMVLIAKDGTIRHQAFGQVDELAVGAALARLIDEEPSHCDIDGGCRPKETL